MGKATEWLESRISGKKLAKGDSKDYGRIK